MSTLEREWTQDEIDADGDLPFICPVTGQPCTTEHDEFCEDYGCARKAGIDVDRDLIARSQVIPLTLSADSGCLGPLDS